MGLLDGVLGNAAKIDPREIQQEFSQILSPGEKVEQAYQLIRDYFVFTNHRLVLVDKQGLTGKKVEYHSIPYKSITHFSIETAGHFDLDAEMKLWISGTQEPLRKQFTSKLNIYEVQAVIAQHVFGGSRSQPSPAATPGETRKAGRADDRDPVPAGPTPARDEREELQEDFCFHCGEVLKAKSLICPSCGGSLE